jgi:hypothetical protein
MDLVCGGFGTPRSRSAGRYVAYHLRFTLFSWASLPFGFRAPRLRSTTAGQPAFHLARPGARATGISLEQDRGPSGNEALSNAGPLRLASPTGARAGRRVVELRVFVMIAAWAAPGVSGLAPRVRAHITSAWSWRPRVQASLVLCAPVRRRLKNRRRARRDRGRSSSAGR